MPVIQLVGAVVIAATGNPVAALGVRGYLLPIAFAALGAALFMDNLKHQKTNAKSMVEVEGYRDSWLIALLYIGTFGSFIGFSFAFGQVLQMNFLAGLTTGGPATAGRPHRRRCARRRSRSSATLGLASRLRAAGCLTGSAAER